MQTIPDNIRVLPELVEHLQSVGVYTFTKEAALGKLGTPSKSFDASARRLAAKGALASPRRGFYVVVPAEYRSAGAPPPSWFIHALMAFHEQPYYVGLLSAAELHGAAHHRPQEFQVVTDRSLRPVTLGRGRLAWFVKRNITTTPTIAVKTHTGQMNVSTPEATAFDLLRYVDAAGQLDNVATVLAELAEKINGTRLVSAAKAGVELSVVQRTGYLLDLVGGKSLTNRLASWLERQRPRRTRLRPDRSVADGPIDARWHLLVNDTVEPDA